MLIVVHYFWIMSVMIGSGKNKRDTGSTILISQSIKLCGWQMYIRKENARLFRFWEKNLFHSTLKNLFHSTFFLFPFRLILVTSFCIQRFVYLSFCIFSNLLLSTSSMLIIIMNKVVKWRIIMASWVWSSLPMWLWHSIME